MNNLMSIILDGQEKEVEVNHIDIRTGLSYPKLPSENEYEIMYDIVGTCRVFLTNEVRKGSEILFIKSADELPQLYEIYEGDKMVTKIEKLDPFVPYDVDCWRFRIEYNRVRL